MNGRKRQRRRRTGSGDVVHVLIMYLVSQAVSFIVVGTRALGRSRHRLVLDTRRNEIHIGDDSDTVEGLGLNDIAIVPFWCSVQLALIHIKLSVFAIIRKVNSSHDTLYLWGSQWFV